MRLRLGKAGQRVERAAGQAPARRLATAQIGNLRQHRGKSDILTSEDVVLANLAVPESRQMAGGDVIHMDQIEASVHKARNTTGRGFEDDAAGRRRAMV